MSAAWLPGDAEESWDRLCTYWGHGTGAVMLAIGDQFVTHHLAFHSSASSAYP